MKINLPQYLFSFSGHKLVEDTYTRLEGQLFSSWAHVCIYHHLCNRMQLIDGEFRNDKSDTERENTELTHIVSWRVLQVLWCDTP